MLDIKSMLADTFIKLIDSNIGFIVVFFVISVLLFFFRQEIGFDFDLTRRGKNRLSEKSLLIMIFSGGAVLFFLFTQEYVFLLSCVLSVILTYFLYLFGFLDRMIDKIEGRY